MRVKDIYDIRCMTRQQKIGRRQTYIICVRKLVKAFLQQRDSCFKQRQYMVAKIKPFLHINNERQNNNSQLRHEGSKMNMLA